MSSPETGSQFSWSRILHRLLHPVGMSEISRWLSGATPPEIGRGAIRTPAGVPEDRLRRARLLASLRDAFLVWAACPVVSLRSTTG